MKNFSFPKRGANVMHTSLLFTYVKTILFVLSLFFFNASYAAVNQDSIPPTLSCPDSLIFSTGPFDCTAYFPIPFPIVSDSCAPYELFVEVHQIILISNPFGTPQFWVDVIRYDGFPGDYATNIGGDELYIRYYLITTGDTSFIDCPLEIVDQVPPTAVCADDLIISIGEDGASRLYAEDIDGGSIDNCTDDVRIEIRYAAGDWGEYVDFDCTQVGEYVTVELRVWDDANKDDIIGNTGDLSSTCSLEILVQDVINPICTAPSDTTLQCADSQALNIDWEDTDSLNTLFGEASTTDNCSATVEQIEIEVNLNDCGFGIITRTFIATDAAGSTSMMPCQQVITVAEIHDYAIKFPKDAEILCGEVSLDTLTYTTSGCDLFTVNVWDEIFSVFIEGHYNVLRTYRVINWCEWNGEQDPILISRDEDCDVNPGDEDVWVLVRTESEGENLTYTTYVDRNNNENSNPYIGNNRCATGTGPLPNGHWANSINNPEIASVGHWAYTQVVRVFDNEEITVETVPYDIFCTTNTDCTRDVEIAFDVINTCIQWSLDIIATVDLFTDGISDGNTNIELDILDFNTIRYYLSGNYPIGNHVLNITLEDYYLNVTAFELPFQVVDCTPPVFECVASEFITLGNQPDGCCAAAIWALDFVETANTDCSIPFIFSIHRAEGVESGSDIPTPEQIGIVLDCNDPVTLLVRVYAWDGAYNPYAVQPDGSVGGANYDYCEVPLLLQGINCPNGISMLSGVIYTEEDEAIQGIEVNLTGSAIQNGLTNDTGQFQLTSNDIEEGNNYTITPYSNTLPENALSTFDMILISKHILGTQLLDSPYKIIAADINASGSVTNIDVIQLRKLLLGEYDEYPNNTFWRFVDVEYSFPDPTNPWAEVFPEIIEVTYGNQSSFGSNFVGVAIGDVNGSAVTNLLGDNLEERGEKDVFVLTTQETALKKGENYQISFVASDIENIFGYQFTLDFNTAILDFQKIENGSTKATNFGLQDLKEGLLTTSWDKITGKPAINNDLFTIHFYAKIDALLSDVLAINSRITKAEAYDETGTLDVKLSFAAAEIKGNDYELYQNQPNPFAKETLIAFHLPMDEVVQLTIQDVSGKTLQVFKKDAKKGHNSIPINATIWGAKGLLFYTLSTATFTATKRMLVIE